MSTVGTPKSPEQIQHDWDTNPRWKGIERTYAPQDVVALQGSVVEEATLARRGAEVLWEQLHDLEWVNALGALTGNMAVQQVRAGLKAIYLSGWQVAGDANLSGHTYPDQSLYPGQLGAAGNPSDQQRAAARRRDRQGRGRPLRGELAGADRRRRRGRLRWRTERLRAPEGDDRRRCRRLALGGPAGLGEEVRSPRWQGAHPDSAAHPHADLGPAGGRRRRCADRCHRPHRRRGGHADHLRCGRA